MLVRPMIARLGPGVRVGTSLPEDLQWWQRAMFAHFVEPLPAVTKPSPAVTCRMFNDLWEVEREVRCSALATRWNAKRKHMVHVKDWDAILGFWDPVNAALGTSVALTTLACDAPNAGVREGRRVLGVRVMVFD